MKKQPKSTRPVNPFNSDFNPDFYDPDAVQVIGDPQKAMSGTKPVYRALTLDDIEDDCPVCQANRQRILAGDPPMAWAYD